MNVVDALLSDIGSNVGAVVDSATNSLLVVTEMELRKYRVLVGYADHCALHEILHEIVIERTIVAMNTSVMEGSNITKSNNTSARPQAAVRAEPCSPTRAQSLIASGLLNAAAQITELADNLTASVMEAVETAMSERDHPGFVDDVACLRNAVFRGIAQNIIERIEQKLRAEPQKRDVLSMPPDPNKWEKLKEAKRSHAAWRRRNRGDR